MNAYLVVMHILCQGDIYMLHRKNEPKVCGFDIFVVPLHRF
jgi:hypothetical protein